MLASNFKNICQNFIGILSLQSPKKWKGLNEILALILFKVGLCCGQNEVTSTKWIVWSTTNKDSDNKGSEP